MTATAGFVGQEAFKLRHDVAAMVPGPVERVLDVGCGPGLTGAALREVGVAEVWGLERDVELAEAARSQLDHVVCGDLDGASVELPDGQFDGLIYADVLEHLVDPWSVLREQRRLLRSGGFAILSIPNVRNLRVLAPLLLRGEWRYTAEGIMSIGHLRFFTTKSMRRLLHGAGYRIVDERANYSPRGRLVGRLSLGLLDDLVAEQRLFLARPVVGTDG